MNGHSTFPTVSAGMATVFLFNLIAVKLVYKGASGLACQWVSIAEMQKVSLMGPENAMAWTFKGFRSGPSKVGYFFSELDEGLPQGANKILTLPSFLEPLEPGDSGNPEQL
jgi:hypothetical protein